ncbi:MAG: UDP-N-acetylmuramoyl-L-alanine--D-glutamate ligase [Opitutales bacterium]
MSERTAIFGAGLSGQAARRLALALGQEVVLFDEGGQGDRAVFEDGDVVGFDRLIFSPGFAADHPWRLRAVQSGVLCQAEIAFAAQYWRGKIIGVTGTNGKSTLTRLLTESLQCAGHQAVSAGNIGLPLSDAVLAVENAEGAYAVCEISSFQAELADGLELDALLWTNFAEDHLDRYASMANYFMAKARLVHCLKEEAICVVGPRVAHWFDLFKQPFGHAVVAADAAIMMDQLAEASVFRRFPYTENFSLAAQYWCLAGEPEAALLQAASDYTLAAHRLDVVAVKQQVRFWNDSKSTNFHASLAALAAVPRPIVWIGGGRAKGGDIEAFARALSSKVDAAVLYGEVAPRLFDALSGRLKSVHLCPRFENAVVTAHNVAQPMDGANVLLSPGFASLDQFQSYEERGKSFISTVLGL